MPESPGIGTTYRVLTPEEQAALDAAAAEAAAQQAAPAPGLGGAGYEVAPPPVEQAVPVDPQYQVSPPASTPPPVEYVPAYPSSSDLSPSGRDAGAALGLSTMGLPAEGGGETFVAPADPYAQDAASAQLPADYRVTPPPSPAPSTLRATAAHGGVNQGSGVPYEQGRSNLDVSRQQNERRIFGFQQEMNPAYAVSDPPVNAQAVPAQAGKGTPPEWGQSSPHRRGDRSVSEPPTERRGTPGTGSNLAAPYNPAVAHAYDYLLPPDTWDRAITPNGSVVNPSPRTLRDNPPGPAPNPPGTERPVWEVLGDAAQGGWQGSEGLRNALGSVTGVYRVDDPPPPPPMSNADFDAMERPQTPAGTERPVWEVLGEGLGGTWQGTQGARDALGAVTGVHRGAVPAPTLDFLSGVGSTMPFQDGGSDARVAKPVSTSPSLSERRDTRAPVETPPALDAPGLSQEYPVVNPDGSPGGLSLPFDANSRPTGDFMNVFRDGMSGAVPTTPEETPPFGWNAARAARFERGTATPTSPAVGAALNAGEQPRQRNVNGVMVDVIWQGETPVAVLDPETGARIGLTPEMMQADIDAIFADVIARTPKATANDAGSFAEVPYDTGVVFLTDAQGTFVGIKDPDTGERIPFPEGATDADIKAIELGVIERLNAKSTSAPATTTPSATSDTAPIKTIGATAEPDYSVDPPAEETYSSGGGNQGSYANDYSNDYSSSFSKDDYGYAYDARKNYGRSYDDGEAESDLKLEDFLKDHDGDGKISAKDRSLSKRAFLNAKRKRGKGKASFDPLNRPETPLRTQILDELDAALPKGAPARRKTRGSR